LRRGLRRLRRVGLAAILLAAALLTYLHWVGLPGFVKDELKDQLRRRGLELDCGRVAFRWYRGIVAESVSLGRSESDSGFVLELPEVAFRLDVRALFGFRLVVRSLEIDDGRLMLPPETEDSAALTLDGLQADLRFAADDTWQFERLAGECLGFRLNLRGTVLHATELRHWLSRVRTPRDTPPLPWRVTLDRFLQHLGRLEFRQSPSLDIDFVGDASRPETLNARLRFTAGAGSSPWGSVESVGASLRFNDPSAQPSESNFHLLVELLNVRAAGLQISRAQLGSQWLQSLSTPVPQSLSLDLALTGIESPWGSLTGLHLIGQGRHLPDQPNLVGLDLRLAGQDLAAAGGRSDGSRLNLSVVYHLQQLVLQQGQWDLQVATPGFTWGNADLVRLTGQFARRPSPAPDTEVSQAPLWRLLAPVSLQCTARVDRLTVSQTPIDRLTAEVDWSAPRLALRSLKVDLFDRHLQAGLACDTTDRTVEGQLALNFDVHRLENLLSSSIVAWLSPYGWRPDQPPDAGARFWCTLPPWSKLFTREGASELGRSLGLQGSLVASDARYRGLPMDNVAFDFHFTNAVWRLTNFLATSPQGRFNMDYTEDQRSKDYRFDIRAHMDPRAFRPLIRGPSAKAFDLFVFNDPPTVEGSVTGRWRSPELTAFNANLHCPAFSFRGEPIEELTARLDYTNGVVRATDVRLRSEGIINAEVVEFAVPHQILRLAGAYSSVPPMRVARAIGDEVVRTLSPYTFDHPPHARVEGWLNVRNTREAGMRFELAGGPFHYWRFNLPEVQGAVQWSNQTVRLQNFQAPFYGGRARGQVEVDLSGSRGAEVEFESRFEDVDFSPLMRDLLQSTNLFEGKVDGTWTLTHAFAEDWDSWNGYGRAELREGHLWDLPVFGGLSDMIGRLGMDLGKSRITGLTADFTMTNSLIHTRNLELESTAMRLLYRGTFDFQGAMNARVEARLLHDTAVVGPLVSLLFSPLTKMLEFKVAGTLADPLIEPLHFPKPLLFPLDPIGALKEMFKPPTSTSSPPPPQSK